MASLLKQTLRSLDELKIFPSKSLGQNFLIDKNVIKKLIGDVKSGDNIVEIGSGFGAISETLLEIGVNLFAIDIDRRLVEFLKNKFKCHSNFHLICGDAVEFPTAKIPNEIQNFHVISNLPYGISSPWMDAILNSNYLPQSMNLIVQEEFAGRFFANRLRSEICPISIFVQSAYDKIGISKISTSVFYPQPTVSSEIIFMRKKLNTFLFKSETKSAIRRIFTKRRKQIKNILNDENECIKNWADELEVERFSRPDEISIIQWQHLDKYF